MLSYLRLCGASETRVRLFDTNRCPIVPRNLLAEVGVYSGMFEQTMTVHKRARNGWAVCASFSGQCVAAGLMLLLPSIYSESLPLMEWRSVPLPAAPAPPDPPQPAKRMRVRAMHANVFSAPRAIPQHVAMIIDEPVTAIVDTGLDAAASVPIAAGTNILFSGLLDDPVLPPPTVPNTQKPAGHSPEAPVHVSGGVQAAKLLRRVLPVYPALAKSARVSGTVHLVGVIAKDGTIRNLQVISGHPLLVNAAIEAVRQWIYQPTLLSGEPVEVIAPIDVNFNLN